MDLSDDAKNEKYAQSLLRAEAFVLQSITNGILSGHELVRDKIFLLRATESLARTNGEDDNYVDHLMHFMKTADEPRGVDSHGNRIEGMCTCGKAINDLMSPLTLRNPPSRRHAIEKYYRAMGDWYLQENHVVPFSCIDCFTLNTVEIQIMREFEALKCNIYGGLDDDAFDSEIANLRNNFNIRLRTHYVCQLRTVIQGACSHSGCKTALDPGICTCDLSGFAYSYGGWYTLGMCWICERPRTPLLPYNARHIRPGNCRLCEGCVKYCATLPAKETIVNRRHLYVETMKYLL